ncbi:pseudouridine synthase [Wolfiporia cocos MD-104 SS10]|uniref:Pseudouridine synthase n=1 Tax=Wolfiporia cocos (strain MD-104) TaxID=742152 RepID=A0A2H3JKY1_WOLCO|nr:pseudouridine synthase [Wolfiporia cocos MD-104 SS10]
MLQTCRARSSTSASGLRTIGSSRIQALWSAIKSAPRSRNVSNSSGSAGHALYVDRGVVVVNKPPDVVCQYNRKKAEMVRLCSSARTLIDTLHSLVDLKGVLQLNADPFPVHRLDKATTGALVLALTQHHARDLAQQFQKHLVEKTYVAVVRGGAQSFPEKAGSLRHAHYIDEDGRVSLQPRNQKGKRAIAETDWEVVASSPIVPLTLVKLRPYTGFKHQLRLETAMIMKAPILGDHLYASAKLSPKITDVARISDDDLYLHSSRLTFDRYCKSGRRARVSVGAPLPSNFVRLCHLSRIPLEDDIVHGGLWINGKRVGQSESDQHQAAAEPAVAEQDDELPGSILDQLGGRWVNH